jgi:hypothetical protein
MRIIIESNDQEGVERPAQVPVSPAQVETVDGGTPSEALTQAVAAEGSGLDAGAPPEWLVEAIQASMQPGMESVHTDTDAGSAPSSIDG